MQQVNTIQKGRYAEVMVVADLVKDGIEIFMPTFGNAACDLIALIDGKPVTIEVKYVGNPIKPGAWDVALRQVRANKTVTTTRKFNANNSMILAVYVAPIDAVAYINSRSIDGASMVRIHEGHVPDMTLGRAAMR